MIFINSVSLPEAIDSFGNRYLLGVFENKADAEKGLRCLEQGVRAGGDRLVDDAKYMGIPNILEVRWPRAQTPVGVAHMNSIPCTHS